MRFVKVGCRMGSGEIGTLRVAWHGRGRRGLGVQGKVGRGGGLTRPSCLRRWVGRFTTRPRRASRQPRLSACRPSCTRDVGRAAIRRPIASPTGDFVSSPFCGLQSSFILLRHVDFRSLARLATALPASPIFVGQFHETRRHHVGQRQRGIPGVVVCDLRPQGQSPGTRLTGRLELEDPPLVCMA